MKNLILLAVLSYSLSSFAQNDKAEIKDNEPEFTCDLVKFDPESDNIELIGNVNFETDIIKLEKADKVVYNQKTKELLATGLRHYVMIDGAVQIDNQAEMKTLRYTIGDRIAYIE